VANHTTRAERPEYLEIGGKKFERNDLTAARTSENEKTVNRRDKQGAPFLMIAGCKYRPVEAYDAFLLSQIQQNAAPSSPRRRRGRSRVTA
jgi:hypothetical protein